MRGTRCWTGCAALACWVVGCGEAPDPPGAVGPTLVGAGSKGQTEMDVLTVRASPDSVVAVPGAVEPSPVEPSDAGSAGPPADAALAGGVFSACRETRVVGCNALYVRMLAAKPDLCVQLVLDDCSENARQGLSVVLPLGWRLSSGSASTDLHCDLKEYDPKSQPALTSTGKISWTQRVRQISGLAIDVQLQLQPPPGSELPAQIGVKTAAPLATVDDCEG
jgi:hypothetical protein